MSVCPIVLGLRMEYAYAQSLKKHIPWLSFGISESPIPEPGKEVVRAPGTAQSDLGNYWIGLGNVLNLVPNASEASTLT